MGKIICLMGKSSTGKDTLFRELLKDDGLHLRTIVPYTTRPRRMGETDGVEYHFVDEETFRNLKAEGRVIEDRAYQTFHGLWRYFTVDDGQFQKGDGDAILIGTLESFLSLRNYFGEETVLPVMITLDDGERLGRALAREKKQENPRYEEMCRRFLADAEDFSEEKIAAAGIQKSFQNDDLERCLKEIKTYLAKAER